MTNLSNSDFKSSLRKLLKRYSSLVGIVLFLFGVILRLSSIGKTGYFWEVTKDIGTFLAVAVAVPFFYEILIKSEERQLFLNDLEEILEKKLPNQASSLKLYENGRPSLTDKVKLISRAQSEVIFVGIAHRSFVGYFEQRPSIEFQDSIFELLKKGIILKCVFLDPDCEIASKYAEDREETELIDRIKNSIESLKKIRCDLVKESVTGNIEIYLSHHFPYFAATCVDGNETTGYILISSYLYRVKKAEVPHLEFSRLQHQGMFNTYWKSIQQIVSDSRRI